MAAEAIPFPYLGASSVIVRLFAAGMAPIVLIRDIDYALYGDGATQTGIIRPLRAYAIGDTIEVLRVTSIVQDTKIVPLQPFPAQSAERSLDRSAMAMQEISDDLTDAVSRSIHLPAGESALALPPASLRRNSVLTFHSETGEPQLRPVGSFPAGPPGPAGNVAAEIAKLRSAPISNVTMFYDGSPWLWTSGDFHDRIASDPTGARYVASSLTDAGAWVRQNPFINVRDFGAKGDGVTVDTVAFNRAIAYLLSLPAGGCLYVPTGIYKVGEIDLTSATADFDRAINIRGDGRFATKLSAAVTGCVILNMVGRNNCSVGGLTIEASSHEAQCGILLSRSATSGHCNNNKFSDLFVFGTFTHACVISWAAESSLWHNCRFWNTNPTRQYRCFVTGTNPADLPTTQLHGGDLVIGPNTDNRMVSVEAYAPYPGARPMHFLRQAGYAIVGGAVICGGAPGDGMNCRLATYRTDPVAGVFSGPLTWVSPHFEVFGIGNTVHWLETTDHNGDAATGYFNGVNVVDANNVVGEATAIVDYDRRSVASRPILQFSRWVGGNLPPGTDNCSMYIFAARFSTIDARLDDNDSTLIVNGFLENVEARGRVRVAQIIGRAYLSTATARPATDTVAAGSLFINTAAGDGQPWAWRIARGGTFGVLSGVTATGSAGSNVITVSSAAGIVEGAMLDIAGDANGPFSVRALSGNQVFLNANLATAKAGAAVGFVAPTVTTLQVGERRIGTVALSAGKRDVVFSSAMPSADYSVTLASSGEEILRWADKTPMGFRIISSVAASSNTVDYMAQAGS